jgi:hypothetical protein
MVLMLREWDLGQGNVWPENDALKYINQEILTGGKKKYRVGIRSKGFQDIPRQFLFVNDDKFDKLYSAYEDSLGSRLPVILQEGTAFNEARLVNFSADSFSQAKEESSVYKPFVTFEEVPYIPDGKAF